MLNHHPTVSDHRGSQSRASTTHSGSGGQARTQLSTPTCDQLRRNLVTGSASMLERQRLCAGVPSFPLYSNRIPLPCSLPTANDPSSLIAGGYSWEYSTVSPPTIGLHDVVAKTRSDATAPFISSPLTTYFGATVNGVPPSGRYASNSHWFAASHCSSATLLTTAAVTPNGDTTTTTPRHVTDSGIASCRRRQRATPDAVVARTRSRQQSRRSFLFTASDDSSSTTSDEKRAVQSPSPVVRAALTKQAHYDEGADSTSMPTSDSAYSDADEAPDVAERH